MTNCILRDISHNTVNKQCRMGFCGLFCTQRTNMFYKRNKRYLGGGKNPHKVDLKVFVEYFKSFLKMDSRLGLPNSF